MARVYVVHDDGRFDFSDLARYGEAQTIFTKDLYPDDANEAMPGVMQHAFDVLADFDGDEDFLCLVGSPVYVAICAFVLGDYSPSKMRMLRFDRHEQKYYEITVQ